MKQPADDEDEDMHDRLLELVEPDGSDMLEMIQDSMDEDGNQPAMRFLSKLTIKEAALHQLKEHPQCSHASCPRFVVHLFLLLAFSLRAGLQGGGRRRSTTKR